MSFITKSQRVSPLVKQLFAAETSIRAFQTSLKRTSGAAFNSQTLLLSNRTSFQSSPVLQQTRFSSDANHHDTSGTDKSSSLPKGRIFAGAATLIGTIGYFTSYKHRQAAQESEIKSLVKRADEVIEKIISEMPDPYLPTYKAREEICRFLGNKYMDSKLEAIRKYTQAYIDFEDSVNTANIGRPASQQITLLMAFNAYKRCWTQIEKITQDSFLVLSDPHLTMIPRFIAYRGHYIRGLEIYSPVSSLPPEFTSLDKLESLKIQNRCLYNIPHEITRLPNLKTLDLSHNKIRLVPDCISGLKNLEVLYLNNNSLIELPDAIGDLPRLSSLELSHNSLEKLPEGMKRLQELTYLNLASNAFFHFPSSVFGLKKLDLLSLSHNQIQRIPNDIETLPNLTTLLLGSNKIGSVSSRIGECRKLEHLDLQDNKLTSIELAITGLPNLKCLVLDKNQLTQIPVELLWHKTLTRLSVGNNPINCTIILPSLKAFVKKKGASITLPACLQKDLKTKIDSLPEALRDKITFDDRS